MRNCVTHFHACDCREEHFKEIQSKLAVAEKALKRRDAALAEAREIIEICKGAQILRDRDEQFKLSVAMVNLQLKINSILSEGE